MTGFHERFKKDWVYHLLIWLVLLLPHGISSTSLLNKGVSLYLWNMLIRDGLVLVVIYGNFLFLIPFFYKKRKWFLFSVGTLLLLGLFLVQAKYWGGYIAKQYGYKESFLQELPFYIFDYARNVIIAFLLFGLREKFRQEKKMNQVQLEKLTTEINYLRAQINPHFLFNTLNNLYGMALKKSEKMPEIILRLSKMMDYMLYDSDETLVYLVKDIENLENYISLERIRQGNNAVINYSLEGSPGDRKIAPLLFLPLVENGFKHGVNELIKEAYLDIHLTITTNDISLSVKNNFKLKKEPLPEQRGGIGLANLQRRLELFYPGKHRLQVQQTDTLYDVQLQISLE